MLLQPNFASGTETAALVGLFSGVLASWAYLAVRTLGRLGEPDWRVVFWFGLVSTVVCAVWQVATSSFHAITWGTGLILLGLGACGTLGQVCMTRAYRVGNTLVVVEHDREVIASSDYLLDFGPGAGDRGGEITAQGTPKEIPRRKESLTGQYLSGRKAIPVPTNRRIVGGPLAVVSGERLKAQSAPPHER